MKNRAFTLIELLVVVLIIGILAAIAVPQYQKTIEKTKATQALTLIKALVQAQQSYYLANGEFTKAYTSLDIQLKLSFCADAGTVVYCQWSGPKDILLEWHGTSSTGKTRWICAATNNNSTAKEICQSYYKEWGGSQTRSNDTHTYYYGPEK